MNIKDFKWTEKRFGTTFANILKKLGGLSKDGTDGSIEYKDDEGNVTKLVTDSNFSSLLAKNGLIEVKWQELKDKRDAGKLIPGSLYRITDYQCTTTKENTRSAGHQFDIVLLALSENKLAEEGWAMEHPTDVYDVTFSDEVILKCYIYDCGDDSYNIVAVDSKLGMSSIDPAQIIFDEANKTASIAEWYASTDMIEENLPYNYFQNSNLSAWKVWYCLDNDKDRFAWADDKIRLKISVNGNVYITTGREEGLDSGEYLYWGQQYKNGGAAVYSKGTPKIGDSVYTWTGSPSSPTWITLGIVEEIEITNGHGVIYRLIDEFNNDIKYDFKNIQFKRKLTDGQYDATNGTETWCYTLNVWYNDMCQDASIVGNTLPNDEGYISGVYGNVFGYATAYDLSIEGADTFAFALEDNVVLSFCDADGYYYGIYSNTIGDGFYSNTIGESFKSNTIRSNFHSNTIGNGFELNTIGNGFNANTIGNSFCANIIGNDFSNKTISDSTRYKNYGNNGVELATKSDIGDIETALNNI